MMTPELLFRAYSDDSQGFNTSSFFAPKAATRLAIPWNYIPREDPDNEIDQLKAALTWKPGVDKFIFWTKSLLFAIGLATYRNFDREKNIKIACIRTSQTRTRAGTRARFRSVEEVSSAHGDPGITNKDGSPRDYSDVFVTTDCFKTGRGTWIADFESLEISGLYELYPSLLANTFGYRKPRLNLLVQDARAYGFQEAVPLSPGAVSTAAALASTFKLAAEKSTCLPIHVLGSLLAFEKRDIGDQSLKGWLERYSDPVIDLDGDDSNDEDHYQQSKVSTKLPEVKEFFELMKLLHCHQIRTIVVAPSIKMTDAEILKKSQAWQAWKSQDIDQRRASRGDREQPRRKNSYRRTNKRSRDDRPDIYSTRHDSVVELVDTDDEIVKLDDTDDEVTKSISSPDGFSHQNQDRSSYEDRRDSRFMSRRERRDREFSSRRRDGTRIKRRIY